MNTSVKIVLFSLSITLISLECLVHRNYIAIIYCRFKEYLINISKDIRVKINVFLIYHMLLVWYLYSNSSEELDTPLQKIPNGNTYHSNSKLKQTIASKRNSGNKLS